MTRYKLTLEYDGTGLLGFQRQKDGPSVQQHVEEAIYGFCQQRPEMGIAGRTDAGVHARGQVIHVDLDVPHNERTIMHGINFHLQEAHVVVVNVDKVADDFHARFHAKRRLYHYHIILRQPELTLERDRAWKVHYELDIAAMQHAATLLQGEHDFTSFRSTECQAKRTTRTLERVELFQQGNRLRLEVQAPSFLHNMVRIIVGTLVEIGKGKLTVEDIPAILDARDRKAAGPTAPAYGLYFMEVEY